MLRSRIVFDARAARAIVTLSETEDAIARRIRTSLRDAVLTVDAEGGTSYLLFLTDDDGLARLHLTFTWDRITRTITVTTVNAYGYRDEGGLWSRFVRGACVRRAKAAFAIAPRAERDARRDNLSATDLEHILRLGVGFRPRATFGPDGAIGLARDGRTFWINYEVGIDGYPIVQSLNPATADHVRKHVLNTNWYADRTVYLIERGFLTGTSYTYAPRVALRTSRLGFTHLDVAVALERCRSLGVISGAATAVIRSGVDANRSIELTIAPGADGLLIVTHVAKTSRPTKTRSSRQPVAALHNGGSPCTDF